MGIMGIGSLSSKQCLSQSDFTIFAVFGRGEKLELVSKKSEDEMNISAGLAKKEKKLQA